MSHQKRIVVCADDFGMNPGIDAGILDLAGRGRLGAVSCLAFGPSLRDSAAALAGLPVDVGLHLNFTEAFGEGQPAWPLPRLIAASYLGWLPASAIIAGIERQIDSFEECFGMPPVFVDGHQHVHQLPVIRESLLQILEARYPGKRIWLRSTAAAPRSVAGRGNHGKARIIAMLGGDAMRTLAGARGYPMTRRLLGVYGFSTRSPEQYRALFQAWLAQAEDGDLLMCHPARFSDESDPIGPQRAKEYTVFSDDAFPDWLRRAQVTSIRFSDFDDGSLRKAE